MHIRFALRIIIIAIGIIVIGAIVFFVHALGGLNARPVTFTDPPTFVELYAAKIGFSYPSYQAKDSEPKNRPIDNAEPGKPTINFSREQTLMHKVFFDGEPHDVILRLFSAPEKVQRVKMAMAFSAVNIEFTHNQESGFTAKRTQFWKDVEKQVPDIQNALFEALIVSAKEGTETSIPYTLAWMPGQDHQTSELLAWAAKHHPDWWTRRFSVYFVVMFGENKQLAASLLKNRTHDPDYRVRKQVLDLRFRRFIGG